jgi:hypothetical protein
MVTDSEDSIDYRSKIEISNPLTQADARAPLLKGAVPTTSSSPAASKPSPAASKPSPEAASTDELEPEEEEIYANISATFNKSAKRYVLNIKSNLEEEKIVIRATKKGSKTLVFTTSTNSQGVKNISTASNLSGYSLALVFDKQTLTRIKIK